MPAKSLENGTRPDIIEKDSNHVFNKHVGGLFRIQAVGSVILSVEVPLVQPENHRYIFGLPLFFIGIAIAHAELRVPLLSQSRYARILSEAGIPAVRHAHHIHLPSSPTQRGRCFP